MSLSQCIRTTHEVVPSHLKVDLGQLYAHTADRRAATQNSRNVGIKDILRKEKTGILPHDQLKPQKTPQKSQRQTEEQRTRATNSTATTR